MNVGEVYFPELPIRHVNFNEGDSDHTSFNNHGYMGIYPFEDYQNHSPYIHTPNDIIGTSVTSFEMSQQFCQMNIGCLAEIATVIDNDPTAINDLASHNAHVYPNPVEGQLTVKAEGLLHVAVYNSIGQQVATVEAYENQCTIDMSNYPAGLYSLQMVSSKGVDSKNVIVK